MKPQENTLLTSSVTTVLTYLEDIDKPLSDKLYPILSSLLQIYAKKSAKTCKAEVPLTSVLHIIIDSLKKLDNTLTTTECVQPAISIIEYFLAENILYLQESATGYKTLVFLPKISGNLVYYYMTSNFILPNFSTVATPRRLLKHHKFEDAPKLNINTKFLDKLNDIKFKVDPYIVENFTISPLFLQLVSDYIEPKRLYAFLTEVSTKSFSYTWCYDNRGRCYSTAYEINPQGATISKNLLVMHKDTTFYMEDLDLLLDIPDFLFNPGYTPEKLITFYLELLSEKSIKFLTGVKSVTPEYSKETEEFISEVLAVSKNKHIIKSLSIAKDILILLQEGQVSTGLTMELDASASGMQIMSVISNDTLGMYYTNLLEEVKIPTEIGKTLSPYVSILTNMNEILLEEHRVVDTYYTSTSIVKDTALAIIKMCTMTHFYNSIETPKRLLTEIQLEVFYQVLYKLFNGCNLVLADINKCFNKDALYHTWTLPDGHRALVYSKTTYDLLDNTLTTPTGEAQFDFSFKEVEASDNFRSLAPHIIHSIDGYILRELEVKLSKEGIDFVPIHDCVVFSPKYKHQVIHAYHKVMSELYASDILETILESLGLHRKLMTFNVTNAKSRNWSDTIANSILGTN